MVAAAGAVLDVVAEVNVELPVGDRAGLPARGPVELGEGVSVVRVRVRVGVRLVDGAQPVDGRRGVPRPREGRHVVLVPRRRPLLEQQLLVQRHSPGPRPGQVRLAPVQVPPVPVLVVARPRDRRRPRHPARPRRVRLRRVPP